jgi:hypothetical protein
METKRLFIGICLDKSGSMASIWPETIAGLNKQILAIQEGATDSKVDTYVSFYVFDKETHKVYDAQSVNFLTEVAEEDYTPKGTTALYGCINDMIDSLSNVAEEANPNNSYQMFIFSDGDEQVAKHLRAATGQRIKEKQDSGTWSLIFVGCDQDLTAVHTHLNIPMGNIGMFKKSKGGTESAFAASADGMKSYISQRGAGQMQTKNYFGGGDKIADLSEGQAVETSANITSLSNRSTPGKKLIGCVDIPGLAPKNFVLPKDEVDKK